MADGFIIIDADVEEGLLPANKIAELQTALTDHLFKW